jgi:hypothetical protein
MEKKIYNYIGNNYGLEYENLENDVGEKFSTNLYKYMSFEKYLARIFKYMMCSDSCYILALIYLNKINSIDKNIILKYNIHALYFISLYIAVKWLDDEFYDKNMYIKISCLSCETMFDMEILFLNLLNFNVYVSEEEYQNFALCLF